MRRLGAALGAFAALLATAVGPGPASTAAPVERAGAVEEVVSTVHDGTTDATPAATVGAVGAARSRIGGANRYEVAVNISRYRYADPSTASVVYLTRSDTFADALTAGTLEDGPVLLTRPSCGTLPTVVAAEIARIDPDLVIALGGTDSICDAVLQQAAAGRPTDRLDGATRFESSASIARRAFPGGAQTVYLTKGEVTPDAVVGGALRDGPILLVSRDGRTVPPATAAVLAEMDPATVVALGGPASVSDAALAAAGEGRATSRLGGANRYEVAVKIAQRAYPDRTSRVYVARGDGANFVDAVVSGMLSDGPVVLTPGTCEPVHRTTAPFLRERHPDRVVALGGTSTLCASSLVGLGQAARPAADCAVLKCVAITYDDGPAAGTPTLLDTLAAKRIPATFFVIGQQVDARPATTRRAYVEGHTIANHTWDHKQLTTLTRAQQQWEVDVTDDELVSHGIRATTLLRPPYGSYDANTRALGFPLILWDVDPRDWEGPPAPETTRSRVVSATRSGSIILLHDLHWNTVYASPGIIEDLHAAGFTFVRLDELVPRMQPGDLVYRRGRVTPAGTPASPSDVIVLDDGTELGPVVDESGVEGLAPQLPLPSLLEGSSAVDD